MSEGFLRTPCVFVFFVCTGAYTGERELVDIVQWTSRVYFVAIVCVRRSSDRSDPISPLLPHPTYRHVPQQNCNRNRDRKLHHTS